MKPKSVHKVPAGKMIKRRKPAIWKKILDKYVVWLRNKKIRESYFVVVASFFMILTLGAHDYFSNYVYIVMINEREVGSVTDAREIEDFVVDLTGRCETFYGMKMEVGDRIDLIREFRPDEETTADTVQAAIRQRMTFLAEAFMVTVDGQPLVPVNVEEDLEEVVDILKQTYLHTGNGIKVIDTVIVEELKLEACRVDPERVLSPEEVASLLVSDEHLDSFQSAGSVELASRGSRESLQDSSYEQDFIEMSMAGVDLFEANPFASPVASETNGVHVETIEEVTIVENIPFGTEYIYDEEMWIVQKEVLDPGEEGKKELVYHITRQNGVEIERIKIGEKILKEPVTQIEALGTAQVPSVGTGQFIWPVEGGGEVTPGRGFSSWHTGIDIHGALGTNILAADSGVVWFSGRGGSQGNYIVIYHGQYWTMYLHNEVNLVNKGDTVEQGGVIARLGSTGRSTGPHLHFEVRLDDGSGEWHTYYQHKPIDPLQFFRP